MADPEPPMDLADDGEAAFIEQALLALDGLLDEEGQAALRARLAGDLERRRLFVQLCLQAQAITEVVGQHPEDVAAGDRARREALALRLAEEWGGTELIRKIEGGGQSGGASRPSRRPWLPWMLAAACLLFLLVNGWVSWRRPGPQPATVAAQDRGRAAGRARPKVAGLDA